MTNHTYGLKKDRDLSKLVGLVADNRKNYGMIFGVAVVFTIISLIFNDMIDHFGSSAKDSKYILTIKLETCVTVLIVYFLLLLALQTH